MSGVRSSCETSETKRCCTRERSASCLIWRCRLSAMRLNDRASVGELVVAALGQALLEVAGGELLAGLGRDPHRADDEPHDEVGDGADQQDEGEPAEQQRALHEVEGLLHVAQVVDQVELVLAGGGHVEQRADDDPRDRCPVGLVAGPRPTASDQLADRPDAPPARSCALTILRSARSPRSRGSP